MKRIALLLVVLAGNSAAQEDLELDRIRLVRTAVDAKLKLGDILLQQGRRAEAMVAYREATDLLGKILGKKRERAPPEIVFEEPLEPAEPLPEIWVRGGRRNLRAGGGSGLTENAVEFGLHWLSEHQDEDGRWNCDGFMEHDPKDDRCDGAGKAHFDVGVTGLSLLAFLGAGYTDRGEGNKYGPVVWKALNWLTTQQDVDGVFGTRATMHWIYNHAIATMAMVEAYSMTGEQRYKEAAENGLGYLGVARNPYLAWRYLPRGGENDTSVTTWCFLALWSGKRAGLTVDEQAFQGTRAWLDKMTDPQFGQVGYNMPGGSSARPEAMVDKFPPEKSAALTAAGVLMRVLMGDRPRTSATIKKGSNLCLERLPEWNPDAGTNDMYYWHFGTLAMFQVGGNWWKKWNQAIKEAVVKHQHPKGSGARTGSWDPLGPWGGYGGRVYSTALMTATMEVYYRYPRAFAMKAAGGGWR